MPTDPAVAPCVIMLSTQSPFHGVCFVCYVLAPITESLSDFAKQSND
jgi:hypothetical protein